MQRPGRWNVVRYGVAIAMKRLDRLPDVRVIEGRTVTARGPRRRNGTGRRRSRRQPCRLTIAVAEKPLLCSTLTVMPGLDPGIYRKMDRRIKSGGDETG